MLLAQALRRLCMYCSFYLPERDHEVWDGHQRRDGAGESHDHQVDVKLAVTAALTQPARQSGARLLQTSADRHRQTYRQTDRQTDRQTVRQSCRRVVSGVAPGSSGHL